MKENRGEKIKWKFKGPTLLRQERLWLELDMIECHWMRFSCFIIYLLHQIFFLFFFNIKKSNNLQFNKMASPMKPLTPNDRTCNDADQGSFWKGSIYKRPKKRGSWSSGHAALEANRHGLKINTNNTKFLSLSGLPTLLFVLTLEVLLLLSAITTLMSPQV